MNMNDSIQIQTPLPMLVKKDKSKFIIGILLAIFAIAIASYFLYGYYNAHIQKAQQIAYESGIINTATYIANEAAQCKQVPLNISGQVINLVSVACLSQG